MHANFSEDVLHGLTSNPKRLPSKYFYDAQGSKIFQEIMAMPEYYLTKAEMQIFQTHAGEIAAMVNQPDLRFIELGAGDASKTYYLLKALLELNKDLVYSPLDISSEALKQAQYSLSQRLPKLKVAPIHGEYFQMLESLGQEEDKTPKLISILGSNLGNFTYQGAASFLKQLNSVLLDGDMLLIGIDLKKSPSLILPAYSDSQGITARFNLNLLERINRELGGHFNTKHFQHYASYEPETGEVKSYLISQKEQEILLEKLNRSFHFGALENLHTEISKKYHPEEFKTLIQEAGFTWVEAYFDSEVYFMDVILKK